MSDDTIMTWRAYRSLLRHYRAAVKDVLSRDFAAEEDIATIQELTGLEAYERGVMDVQERLAGLTNDLVGDAKKACRNRSRAGE